MNQFILSKAGADLIAKFEGKHLKMYYCPAGHPTIGIGHKLTSHELKTGIILIKGKPCLWKNGLTNMQVELLFDQDTDYFEAMINQHVSVQLTQNKFDALVSFIFNLGPVDFLSSTLLKKILAKNYSAVPTQLKRWVYGRNPKTGKKEQLSGLIKRRQAESDLWEGTA